MRLILLVSVLLTQACATSLALTSARDQFRQGNAQGALDALNEVDISHRDKLLLLLDKGLVAQAAGQYDQSVKAFETAYQLIEELEYISVRDQSSAIITSDWALRYSGEYSERLWIHTFQMINYLLMDSPTGAAVEARRAVAIYDQHDDVLDHDLFTRYLMAVSFDAAGQFDSAAVEYRKLARITEVDTSWQKRSREKELILMIASGFIQPKYPGDLIVDIDARVSFPYYPETNQRPPDIDVRVQSKALPLVRVDTPLLAISRSALAKRGKAIATRQALRLATKYALAENIEAQNELAGGIVRLFLLAIEQADTRSWETLPAYLSLVKLNVPDNATSVTLTIDNANHYAFPTHSHRIPLDPDNKKTQFHMIRTGIAETAEPLASP